MEALVSERIHAQLAFEHGDVAGQFTSRIGLKDALKLRCLIRVEAVAQDLVLTLKEADAQTGGSTQDLVRCLPVIVIADGEEPVVMEENGSAEVTVAALNSKAGYVMVEFQGSDLSEGFSHVSIGMASAALRNGSATWEADTERKPAYKQDLKV